MATAQILTRRFNVNGTMLEDALPDASPAESLKVYEGTYPFLAHCSLGDPSVVGDALVYPVEKPPAQTKGAA